MGPEPLAGHQGPQRQDFHTPYMARIALLKTLLRGFRNPRGTIDAKSKASPTPPHVLTGGDVYSK